MTNTMPDKEIIRVATFMEPKPLLKGSGVVYRSAMGWWKWISVLQGFPQNTLKYEWLPNKDPRKSMDVAMEVLEEGYRRLNKLPSDYGWIVNHGCDGVYYCSFTRWTPHNDDKFPEIITGEGATKGEAVVDAIVDLIEYLKERVK